jgi:hypothetical protein
VGILKNDAAILGLTKQYMITKGWWPGAPASSEGEATDSKSEPLSITEGTPRKALCDKAAHPQGSPSQPPAANTPSKKGVAKEDKFASIEIHRNFKTWANCPPLHLRMLFGRLEPISCSMGNIRQSLGANQREMPKALALELMEYITGINPMSEVGDARRLTDILEQWADLNEKRKRPAKQLAFPVHWPSSGVYHLTKEAGRLMITNTIKDIRKEIAKASLVECEVEDLWIQFNYSDVNATIRHNTNKAIADLCACHFFAEDSCESPSKKRRVVGKQGEEALEGSPKDRGNKKKKEDHDQAWQLQPSPSPA